VFHPVDDLKISCSLTSGGDRITRAGSEEQATAKAQDFLLRNRDGKQHGTAVVNPSRMTQEESEVPREASLVMQYSQRAGKCSKPACDGH